jgi:hypothetical protein
VTRHGGGVGVSYATPDRPAAKASDKRRARLDRALLLFGSPQPTQTAQSLTLAGGLPIGPAGAGIGNQCEPSRSPPAAFWNH